MKFATFMTIAAVLALVFGLGFILIPAQVISGYGITLEVAGQWIARYLGSAFIGVAAIAWLARNAEPGAALRAIILGNFIACLCISFFCI